METSLTKQMAMLFIGRAVAFSFTFLAPIILVRIFSTDDFGLYKQLFLIYGTLISVLNLGLTASLFYFLPGHKEAERDIYIRQSFFALAAIGLFAGIVLIFLKAQVAGLVNNPAVESYVPYLAIFVALSLVTSILEHLMIILKQSKVATLTYVVSDLLRAGIIIAISILTHSMLALVIGAVAWAVLRLIVLLIYLRKLGVSLAPQVDPKRLVEQLKYSVPFGLAVVPYTLAYSLHMYVVSYLYTPALFAIYSVGCLQLPIVWIMWDSVSDVTLVKLTELSKQGLLGEARTLIGDSVVKLSLFLFPIATWLIVVAHDLIVILFTDRFYGSIEIWRVFLLTIPVAVLQLDYVPRAFNDTRFILRVYLMQVTLNAILLYALIPLLGLPGAALATVLGISVTAAVIMRKAASLLKVSIACLLPWRHIGQIVAMSLAAGFTAWLIHRTGMFNSGVRLVLSGFVFCVSYGLLLLTTERGRQNGKLLGVATAAIKAAAGRTVLRFR